MPWLFLYRRPRYMRCMQPLPELTLRDIDTRFVRLVHQCRIARRQHRHDRRRHPEYGY
jgi:hypothetical protein